MRRHSQPDHASLDLKVLTLKSSTMLGEVPGDWEARALAELLSEHYPGDWGEERGLHMAKVLRSTNLTKEGRLDVSDVAVRALSPRKTSMLAPKRGDILLERSGGGPDQPVGRVGFVEDSMAGHAFSNFLHLLRPDADKVNSRFLGWVLYQVNRTGRIVRLEQQTTQMRNLNFRDYLTMPLPYPPSKEQAAIARILDAVDTALMRTCDAAERAQNLLASVVADLLGRGVAGNGRLRCPLENPGAFAVTALGGLPRDWRLSTVGDEFDVQSGFTLNSERRPRLQKRQYLRVANVQRDFLDLSDVQELEAKDDEFSLRILAPDDLVVVEGHADSMQIGRCARVTEDAAGMTFQNHLFRLRTTGGMTAGFACIWLNSNYAKRYWNARCATSSGLHTINQRMLKQLALPVPSPPEQRAITSIVEQCKRVRDAHFQKQAKLQNLKHSLTHDLLTGKTRVSDLTEAPAS